MTTTMMLRFGALMLPPVLLCCAAPPIDENVDVPCGTMTVGEGDKCAVDDDCSPAEKPCQAATCVGGVCKALPIPTGDPCQSGVGVCDSQGECLFPDKWTKCKAWDDRGAVPCDDASECDDGTPCTDDTCEAGWCRHAPLPDGKQCGPNLSCSAGLCCVPW